MTRLVQVSFLQYLSINFLKSIVQNKCIFLIFLLLNLFFIIGLLIYLSKYQLLKSALIICTKTYIYVIRHSILNLINIYHSRIKDDLTNLSFITKGAASRKFEFQLKGLNGSISLRYEL